MWIIKPADFDPLKNILYSCINILVQDRKTWLTVGWGQMIIGIKISIEGYIVACVDGRGTGFKGRDFKKVTQKELGKFEVEDQIAAAKKLSGLPYIDKNRIGIWGWSYGGFMTTNCIFKGNDVFEMAIAVAPVTSWRFYDTIYTERYMQLLKKMQVDTMKILQ